LQLCPEPEFLLAIERVMAYVRSESLARMGGTKAVLENYQRKYAVPCMAEPDLPLWPLTNRSSKRPLLVNMADGSTGTRFVSKVLKKIPGMRVKHHDSHLYPRVGGVLIWQNQSGSLFNWGAPNAQAAEYEHADMTSAWDEYDFFTDTPASSFAAQLFATHPGNTLGVMHTIRDPFDWVESRVSHHTNQSDTSNSTLSPGNGGCAVNFTRFMRDNHDGVSAQRDMFTELVWVTCRAYQHRSPDLVFLLNLFDSQDWMRLASGLWSWLGAAGWNVSKAALVEAYSHSQAKENRKRSTKEQHTTA